MLRIRISHPDVGDFSVFEKEMTFLHTVDNYAGCSFRNNYCDIDFNPPRPTFDTSEYQMELLKKFRDREAIESMINFKNSMEQKGNNGFNIEVLLPYNLFPGYWISGYSIDKADSVNMKATGKIEMANNNQKKMTSPFLANLDIDLIERPGNNKLVPSWEIETKYSERFIIPANWGKMQPELHNYLDKRLNEHFDLD